MHLVTKLTQCTKYASLLAVELIFGCLGQALVFRTKLVKEVDFVSEK